MERDVAELPRDALALSPEARAALIESLNGSLDQAVDPGAEEAWREEIRRRLQQIDGGAVDLIPWEAARRRLRSRLER
jgi:putative addiction module component (TIGR02574 family)